MTHNSQLHARTSMPSLGYLVAWSLLLAILVCLPAIVRFQTPKKAGSLELLVTSAQPGMAQLFFDRGQGINGDEFTTARFPAGKNVPVSIRINEGTIRSFRLDPTQTAGPIKLHAFRLRDARSGVVRQLDPRDFDYAHDLSDVSPLIDGVSMTATGTDPIMHIPMRPPVTLGDNGDVFAPIMGIIGVLSVAVLFLVIARGYFRASVDLAPASRHTVWLAAAATLLFLPRIAGLGDPLLDWHHFRQTQTALSAYWFTQEGVTLPNYPLPVLGRPWTAPMEFPTFQLCVAGLHALSLPLDLAARGFALTCFVAATVLLARFLIRENTPPLSILAVGAFAFTSPFALVWSRASLIEFPAVFLGLAYVGAALASHAGGFSATRYSVLLIAGVLAALTKITSLTVFWPAVAFLGLHHIWITNSPGSSVIRLRLLRSFLWGTALLIPIAAGAIWTHQSDAVKQASETTAWLSSKSLAYWNFGSVAQRLDPSSWAAIGRRIHASVLPWTWPFVLAGLLALRSLSPRMALATLGLVGGAAGTVLVFFNLYVVHDYYLSAVVFPLWLCAGLGFGYLATHTPAVLRPSLLAILLVGLGIASWHSRLVQYAFKNWNDDEVVRFAEIVRAHVPSTEELIVLGDDWNPRIAYYSRRKALMDQSVAVSEAFLRRYSTDHGIGFIVSTNHGESRRLALFPSARLLARTENFTLYRIMDIWEKPQTATPSLE